MSGFNLICQHARVPDPHKLHFWYDGLRADIRSRTDYDPVTKERFVCIDDAQQAALAVDSFYSHDGTAGTTYTPGLARGLTLSISHALMQRKLVQAVMPTSA